MTWIGALVPGLVVSSRVAVERSATPTVPERRWRIVVIVVMSVMVRRMQRNEPVVCDGGGQQRKWESAGGRLAVSTDAMARRQRTTVLSREVLLTWCSFRPSAPSLTGSPTRHQPKPYSGGLSRPRGPPLPAYTLSNSWTPVCTPTRQYTHRILKVSPGRPLSSLSLWRRFRNLYHTNSNI